MKKEANGKPEQGKEQAGQRIPIESFSSKRWPVQMKYSSTSDRSQAVASKSFAGRIPALCSRELNLDLMFEAADQKLAA